MLMIWHMEHRHTGETCFSGDEAKKTLWDQAIESAKENGVTVLQFLVNASAPVSYTHLTLPTNREV